MHRRRNDGLTIRFWCSVDGSETRTVSLGPPSSDKKKDQVGGADLQKNQWVTVPWTKRSSIRIQYLPVDLQKLGAFFLFELLGVLSLYYLPSNGFGTIPDLRSGILRRIEVVLFVFSDILMVRGTC